MNLHSDILTNLEWSGAIINLEGKQKVADEIAARVKDGDVLGVGSGSTVYVALLAISKRIKEEGLQVKAIPTSIEISLFCSKLGIPLTTLYEYKPDWLFDGADEVDPDKNLIKGRGGALFKEKLLNSKLVKKLGTNFPVPIEVFPMALLHVEEELKKIGATELLLRPAKGKDGPIVTENGNLILDARFHEIGNDMEVAIKSITGVIDSGLFINYDVEIIKA
jgi:ribose 5-phosphate isomerase A